MGGGHRLDLPLPHLGHLGVGQGAVEGPQPQMKGQAAPPDPRLGPRYTSKRCTASTRSPPASRKVASTAPAGTSSATTKARSMSLAGNRLTGDGLIAAAGGPVDQRLEGDDEQPDRPARS